MSGKTILAIDPGSTESAWVVYDQGKLIRFGIDDNDTTIGVVAEFAFHDHGMRLAIEDVRSFGQVIGQTILDTAKFIGAVGHCWKLYRDIDSRPCLEIPRKTIVTRLCGLATKGDPAVRRAIINRYGGEKKAVGTKKAPGPLYGVTYDVWQALAVAITADETEADDDK